MIIGIDLGTTHSVAAYLTPTGPQLIPNALGETLTPSVIGIDESDRLLVGRAAQEFQVLHPERYFAGDAPVRGVLSPRACGGSSLERSRSPACRAGA